MLVFLSIAMHTLAFAFALLGIFALSVNTLQLAILFYFGSSLIFAFLIAAEPMHLAGAEASHTAALVIFLFAVVTLYCYTHVLLLNKIQRLKQSP